MKFGRFEHQGRVFFGAVEGDQVSELEGSPLDRCQITSRRHVLPALKLLVPCMPGNFYCAGLNYAAHIEWANRRTGGNRKVPGKARSTRRCGPATLYGSAPTARPRRRSRTETSSRSSRKTSGCFPIASRVRSCGKR
jgi:2-keto-4-pentenoate hydratase/2-oxohepta-3-ene-1,7-dioic acid hydratase in catechol pathway